MLDKVNLNQSLDKATYKEELRQLEKRLSNLQQTIQELNIPVIIALEGWSAAGKGTLISKLLHPLDPRHFNVYTLGKFNEDMQLRPFLWRYFIKTPFRGRIAIFDKSWHRLILPETQQKINLSPKERKGFYYDVNAFEKQLTDDGALIIKFFLHISKEEQKKRFKELQRNPDTNWRIDNKDLEQNEKYDQYIKNYDQMIRNTSTTDGEWSIIEANDNRYAIIKTYKIVILKIEEEIKRRTLKITESVKMNSSTILLPEISILKSVDLNKTIEDKEYSKKLDVYQNMMSQLGYKLYAKRKSVIIVYEGWDAAGKGGNIKRLTEKLDPRGYEVIPIAAPSPGELSHHYLWRFYNQLPKDGHMAIFDRSWYGRVMVERIEGFCKEADWQRAYKEINDFERHLANHDTIIFKFWLHIDKDEQLRRFESRQIDPLKQYKITDEDWRNREKWDDYEQAVDEMLFKTSTPYAPWTIVESNHKKFARIKVLEIVANELDKRLKENPSNNHSGGF